MNKWIQICLLACLMPGSSIIFADVCCSDAPDYKGCFLGIGASYNSVNFRNQYSASGTGDVFDETPTLVATGSAGGPAAPLNETLDTLAPELQFGYSCRSSCSPCFWGVKCVYQYLDITSTNKLLDTPQAGFLDPVNESTEAFTGNVITKSAQNRVNHMLHFLAFTGLSCNEFNLYLGAGPSLFRTETNIYQAFGFANRDGLPREATGEPVSFSGSKWVLGGAAQLGFSYFLTPCWFVDFNYTYAISHYYRHNFSSPYITNLVGGYTNVGFLYINTKTQIRAQSLNLTINRKF